MSRVWSVEHGEKHFCVRLPETGIVFCVDDLEGATIPYHFASYEELAQFIVDSLNEKEVREAVEQEAAAVRWLVQKVPLGADPTIDDNWSNPVPWEDA